MISKWSGYLIIGWAACLSWTGYHRSLADEGMLPISQLDQLKLSARGIQLSVDQLFNPDQVSLVDGICRVNGCTGSFLSSDGLIITNHHCAYDAIQQASTPSRDLLMDGFQAKTRSDEIPASAYVVRITEDYRDVSKEVLTAVAPGMGFLERTKSLHKRCRELEQEAEQQHPGLRAEVAEMFTGRSYVLFLYTYLRDVRLVFAPPASVGNFGGEVDNWEWPRHTGDFALLRAYTAPDGSSAIFSPDNVPYRPKRVVRVNRQGVSEADAVFLLGYPGRTARHKTASFIQYEQQVRLPLTVASYTQQIDLMTQAGEHDREVEIKMTARIKSLANVQKRSRGQLWGLERAGILAARLADEEKLQQFIQADPARAAKYGRVLAQIAEVYRELEQHTPFEFQLEQLQKSSRVLTAAIFLIDAAHQRCLPDVEREPPYADKNFQQSVQAIKNGLRDFHPPTEKRMLQAILSELQQLPASRSVAALMPVVDQPSKIDSIIATTKLGDHALFDQLLALELGQLLQHADPALRWINDLYGTYLMIRDQGKLRDGRLNELYGLLLEIKPSFLQSSFVPDANGTLRLTSGRVRGYSPQDAIFKNPITTFRGVVEKSTGKDPFVTPSIMVEKWQQRQLGGLEHPVLQDIPVAILYDTDTTGGNSGSPVLNSRGELVGVNFDRCFEATINDFAWNANYSRSIGVDIRYVLWIIGTVYGAEHLLQELLADE